MKYILKKEYPGSPKLGNIIDNLENDWIENYPEFWEEVVVEKDYEILELSLQRSIKHQIVSALKNSENYTISLLSCNGNKIHSVKRLSDSEIFTIGDKVFSEYVNYTINKIDIVNDKCMVSALYDTNNPNGSRLHYNLNNIKKSKQPLFTTEDGVDIFEGDKYFICTASLSNCINNEGIVSKFFKPNPNYKYFSTKEKAEEYILLNKPCLSYGDVQEYLKVKDCNKVLDLVQSKIQQSV